MTTKININGALEEEACISVLDHGFLFGDSVYEVVATLNSQPVFMNEHLKRLRNSAKELALALPYNDEKFKSEIQKTLDAAGNRESYIRIIVTRGVGEIDLDPVSCLAPTVIILVTDSVVYPEESYKKGIHLSLVSVKRNPKEALNPGIKTGNYLNNVLAKIEANRAGAADALMLNPDGILTECTTSNFFLVKREGY